MTNQATGHVRLADAAGDHARLALRAGDLAAARGWRLLRRLQQAALRAVSVGEARK